VSPVSHYFWLMRNNLFHQSLRFGEDVGEDVFWRASEPGGDVQSSHGVCGQAHFESVGLLLACKMLLCGSGTLQVQQTVEREIVNSSEHRHQPINKGVCISSRFTAAAME
jgi:hypothetical protein